MQFSVQITTTDSDPEGYTVIAHVND